MPPRSSSATESIWRSGATRSTGAAGALDFGDLAGRELKVLSKISLGATIWAPVVAANGTLYIASKNYLWAVQQLGQP